VKAILCVDHNRADLQKLSMILRSSGYISLPAATTEEALSAFSASRVDLVILAHGTGEAALAARLRRIRDVPTIMLANDPERTQKPPGVDVVSGKPFHARQLLSIISVLLADVFHHRTAA
jgi:DNA-binding response OmpR family regulator